MELFILQCLGLLFFMRSVLPVCLTFLLYTRHYDCSSTREDISQYQLCVRVCVCGAMLRKLCESDFSRDVMFIVSMCFSSNRGRESGGGRQKSGKREKEVEGEEDKGKGGREQSKEMTRRKRQIKESRGKEQQTKERRSRKGKVKPRPEGFEGWEEKRNGEWTWKLRA